MAGKVPDNTLLSHDLFEGLFARAALATDIELFEEFPSHYVAAAARQHRWARGDWQLLPWIFGKGGNPREKQRQYSIPAISRWKMLDNLRRTLSAPAMFLTLLAGWLMSPLSPWMWTRFVLPMISIKPLLPFLFGLTPRLGGISRRTHIRSVLTDFSLAISQIGLTISFLAHQAWLMSDAVLRTLVRLLITRRNLLEWITAAQAKHAVNLNLYGIFRRMAGGVLLALLAFVVICFGRHQAMPAALPFILLWAASPAIARWISEPPRLSETEPLSSSETQALRMVSRRTWRFFEVFVSPQDHLLPPDNFQEEPKPVVAHRTSPTNMGLYLISMIAARDFGWLGSLETVDRLEATLGTMRRLESFRGHFFNWYDTRELRPLDPKYVSSVDSGNLAGHLLVLGNSCRELAQKTSIDARMLTGLQDTIWILQKALSVANGENSTHTITRKRLSNAIEALAALVDPVPGNAMEWALRLAELRERSHTLDDIAQTLLQEEAGVEVSELRVWAAAARATIESHARDAEILIPWTRLHPKEIMGLGGRMGNRRQSGRPSSLVFAPPSLWRMPPNGSRPH